MRSIKSTILHPNTLYFHSSDQTWMLHKRLSFLKEKIAKCKFFWNISSFNRRLKDWELFWKIVSAIKRFLIRLYIDQINPRHIFERKKNALSKFVKPKQAAFTKYCFGKFQWKFWWKIQRSKHKGCLAFYFCVFGDTM